MGALGSTIANLLYRSGFNLEIWDHDTVGDHNLVNQLFYADQIGMNKAEAVAETLRTIDDAKDRIIVHPRKCADNEVLRGVVILAADSMNFCKAMARNLIGTASLVIEGRMGAANGKIYVADYSRLDQAQRLVDSFFDDNDPDIDEMSVGLCGSKTAISPIVSVTAGYIAQTIIDYVSTGVTFNYLNFTVSHPYTESEVA